MQSALFGCFSKQTRGKLRRARARVTRAVARMSRACRVVDDVRRNKPRAGAIFALEYRRDAEARVWRVVHNIRMGGIGGRYSAKGSFCTFSIGAMDLL